MAPQNLWGEFPNVEDVRTPTIVLKEQAAQLSTATKGVLRGKVSVRQSGGWFTLQLRVVAPAIEGYEYTVLDVMHPIDPYPLTIVSNWDKGRREDGVKCNNEDEFVAALAAILQDDRVKRIVAALLAQSKAMGKGAG